MRHFIVSSSQSLFSLFFFFLAQYNTSCVSPKVDELATKTAKIVILYNAYYHLDHNSYAAREAAREAEILIQQLT